MVMIKNWQNSFIGNATSVTHTPIYVLIKNTTTLK